MNLVAHLLPRKMCCDRFTNLSYYLQIPLIILQIHHIMQIHLFSHSLVNYYPWSLNPLLLLWAKSCPGFIGLPCCINGPFWYLEIISESVTRCLGCKWWHEKWDKCLQVFVSQLPMSAKSSNSFAPGRVWVSHNLMVTPPLNLCS